MTFPRYTNQPTQSPHLHHLLYQTHTEQVSISPALNYPRARSQTHRDYPHSPESFKLSHPKLTDYTYLAWPILSRENPKKTLGPALLSFLFPLLTYPVALWGMAWCVSCLQGSVTINSFYDSLVCVTGTREPEVTPVLWAVGLESRSKEEKGMKEEKAL